jgi:hypothetical protein
VRAITGVLAFPERAVWRFAVCSVPWLSLVACAEATSSDTLSPGTLMQGGSAGEVGSAGTGAVAGMPSAGDTSVIPMAGTSLGGTPSTAGTGGSSSGMGGSSSGMGGMGGSAGTEGKAGAGGMGGTSGTGGASGFRYARQVALTEQNGEDWASCAELDILTTGGTPLSRVGWTITADSQETDDEVVPATNAMDGDANTFWHTAWEPAPDDVDDAKPPHWLTYDMKSGQTVTGFQYLPRQVGENGRIANYEFYLSNDPTNWGTAKKTGTFSAGTAVQKVTF